MIDVGTRSAYVASAFAARRMAAAKSGLIANISSSGAQKYAWHVAYGVGKAALDRLTADTAHELRELGVAVVSLWPGLVRTERIEKYASQLTGLSQVKSESQRFTGRAVAALAADPDVLRHTGRALASRDLADEYGFTDVDGSLPDGPLKERPYPTSRR
jgi:NAD(P)-dependent dehydrogenase (short-subunit alcohol dehydrogenase family)